MKTSILWITLMSTLSMVLTASPISTGWETDIHSSRSGTLRDNVVSSSNLSLELGEPVENTTSSDWNKTFFVHELSEESEVQSPERPALYWIGLSSLVVGMSYMINDPQSMIKSAVWFGLITAGLGYTAIVVSFRY